MAASTSLRSIPGIKGPSACAIIAELGVDMSAFQSPAHLVSWAVLKPRNDESAGKKSPYGSRTETSISERR